MSEKEGGSRKRERRGRDGVEEVEMGGERYEAGQEVSRKREEKRKKIKRWRTYQEVEELVQIFPPAL